MNAVTQMRGGDTMKAPVLCGGGDLLLPHFRCGQLCTNGNQFCLKLRNAGVVICRLLFGRFQLRLKLFDAILALLIDGCVIHFPPL